MIEKDDIGLVWFRNDLRLHDQEAIDEALKSADKLIFVYVFDDRKFNGKTALGYERTGQNRKSFVSSAVLNLKQNLQKKYKANLIVREGKTEDEIFRLVKKYDVRWVFCNRERTPVEIEIQDALENRLWSIGREMRYSRGKMLIYTADLPFPITHVPDSFSSFKKEVDPMVSIREPIATPEAVHPLDIDEDSIELDCIDGDNLEFYGGESKALECCAHYVKNNLSRDYGLKKPKYNVLRMSPYVALGCLSPKYIVSQFQQNIKPQTKKLLGQIKKLLLYRDFCRLMVKKNGLEKFKSLDIESATTEEFLTFIDKLESEKEFSQIISEIKDVGFTDYNNRAALAHRILDEDERFYAPASEWFESMLIDYDPCSNYVNWYKLFQSLEGH